MIFTYKIGFSYLYGYMSVPVYAMCIRVPVEIRRCPELGVQLGVNNVGACKETQAWRTAGALLTTEQLSSTLKDSFEGRGK